MIEELLKNMEEPKIDTVVGEALRIDDRIFYPIIQIFTFKGKREGNKQDFFTKCISPLAIVVMEPTEQYVIKFTDDEIDPEEFIQMVESLKGKTIKKSIK
ncbi:MAG: hypothetical protein FJ150_04305 [Euryarchaeota archaeon]|nr:hypothetical protein [Euryarchaeota archaeon]